MSFTVFTISHANYSCSIIFVHGLHERWQDTWLDPADTTLWVGDLLHRDFPVAIVWALGFDVKGSLSHEDNFYKNCSSLLDLHSETAVVGLTYLRHLLTSADRQRQHL